MTLFTDQTGYTIELPHTPARIVSLVPSQTELLADLGLDKAVKGITKFCVHPESWLAQKTIVGGTKNIRPGVIRQLQPDLIIANKEENVKEQVELLRQHYPVWLSDVNTLEDATRMIEAIGEMTGTMERASALNQRIDKAFTQFSDLMAGAAQEPGQFPRPLTAYLIWQNPYMAAGGHTFIDAMMAACGLVNIFKNRARYPVVTIDDIRHAGCELLLLSSEPYPFREKHIEALREQLPHTKIMLADGEVFSWYGSRLLQAPAYFSRLWQEVKAPAG